MPSTPTVLVALYARVSTKQHGQDPETQLLPLRDCAKLRGYSIVDEYVDIGISGAKESRPQLDRLMRDARRHRFRVVLVARFDRFARSTSHLLRALAEFQKHEIDFVSINEAVDTSTPVGKMVFTILGAVAEMERSLIRERVVAGVERAKRQGKQLGRPRLKFDSEKVAQMVKLGRSISAIAKELQCSRSTVRGILAHGEKPTLRGQTK